MGLVGLTRSVAVELAAYGICVNAVSPGPTRHPGIETVIPDALWAIERNRLAIKRTTEPDDLVGAVSFLVSEDTAFVTGQTMMVDGGQVFCELACLAGLLTGACTVAISGGDGRSRASRRQDHRR